ncbi:hypothetical protein D3C77_153690 [compost metagenome]
MTQAQAHIGHTTDIHGQCRVNDTAVPTPFKVLGHRQHHWQRPPCKRVPGQRRISFQFEPSALERQIPVIGRIAGNQWQPLAVHRVLIRSSCLLRRKRWLFLSSVPLLQHNGVGRPNREIARLASLQTQVDSPVRFLQLWHVHTTQRLIERSANHQTGSGNSTVVLIHFQTLHEAAIVGLARECRMGRTVQPQYHASTLDRAVGAQQLGTDDAHFRTLRVVEQRIQPVVLDNDGIALQQHQIIATSMTSRHVVDSAVIELGRITQHADTRCLQRRHTVEPGTGSRVSVAVVQQKDFVVSVGGFFHQGGDTTAYPVAPPLDGNDNRHQRRIRMAVVDAMNTWPMHLDAGLKIAALMQVPLQDSLFLGVVHQIGRGTDTHRFTDMCQTIQPIGLFDQPQQQAELNGPGAFGIEPARIQKNIPSIEPVTGHVRRTGQEHVQIEVRTQQGVQLSCGCADDLVRIHRPDTWRIEQFQCQYKQPERSECSARTDKAQPLAVDYLPRQIIERRNICINGNMDIDELITLPLQTLPCGLGGGWLPIRHNDEIEAWQIMPALLKAPSHQCRLPFGRETLPQPMFNRQATLPDPLLLGGRSHIHLCII